MEVYRGSPLEKRNVNHKKMRSWQLGTTLSSFCLKYLVDVFQYINRGDIQLPSIDVKFETFSSGKKFGLVGAGSLE